MADLERVEEILDERSGTRVRLRLSKQLIDDWAEIVPEPWRSGSEPLVVLGGELVVRANTSHGVRLLRYAVGDLLERLHGRFGTETITEVRVVAPSGRESTKSP